jgi:ankyrin repeat protein
MSKIYPNPLYYVAPGALIVAVGLYICKRLNAKPKDPNLDSPRVSLISRSETYETYGTSTSQTSQALTDAPLDDYQTLVQKIAAQCGGDVEKASQIIAEQIAGSNFDIDKLDFKGQAPLHYAVGHPNVTAAFLRCGANPNIRGPLNIAPIHLAAQINEAVDSIKALIIYGRGLELDAQDARQETALHKVVKNDNLSSQQIIEVVKLLTQSGAKLNVVGIEGTPLDLSQEEDLRTYLIALQALTAADLDRLKDETLSTHSSPALSPHGEYTDERTYDEPTTPELLRDLAGEATAALEAFQPN